jgi:anti-anti-sigma factor
MTVDTTTENGVTIVTLQGRLDAPAVPEAERGFLDAVEAGAHNVLVDLAGVEYISSGGVRVIVVLAKALEKVDGNMKLCNLNPFVSEVFKITNLASRYDIRSDRMAGLAAFAAESEVE